MPPKKARWMKIRLNFRLREIVKVCWNRVSGNRRLKTAVPYFDQVSAVMDYVAALIILLTIRLWKIQSIYIHLDLSIYISILYRILLFKL